MSALLSLQVNNNIKFNITNKVSLKRSNQKEEKKLTNLINRN